MVRMKVRYITVGMAVLAMLFLFNFMHAQGASISTLNMTETINSTATYINTVNQSGYLVFYPNLVQAYGYLNQAKNQSQTNPQYAYLLLAKARSSAQSQEAQIDQYKTDSLYVLIALAFILVISVYLLMRPYKPVKGARKRHKS
jgi:predicted PurR-regulated permease PerM